MKVENELLPTQEQIEGLMDPSSEGPVYMFNMLKFKDKAVYEDGRETNLTGEEAYDIYWEKVTEVLHDLGGGAMFYAPVKWLMLGEVEDIWDKIGIAMYPSRKAILEMIQSEELHAIGVHRDAGLAGQLNIETVNPQGIWPKG